MTFTPQSLHRGDAVRVRGERWRVQHVSPYDGCAIVELAGAERANAGSRGRFILPFEPLDHLAEPIERPRVAGAARWRNAAARALADAAPSWGSLRAAAAANIALLPYQLEPALASVRGLACRLLLADEVGLGKTIQAGLVVAELLVRERDARVLIVTPASLREQWREELRERFAIGAAVIDAAALARATADLPAGVNPWAIPQVAIASIDFLKRPDVVRALEPLAWDLVAFDEAHALCGRSDRALAAGEIAARARRVVVITATPHSGDPAAYDRLRALGRLRAHDPLLTFRRSRADAGLPGSRVTRCVRIAPSAEEARMHRELRAYARLVSREAPKESAAAARLALVVLSRRAASSAASLARSVERRIAFLEGGSDALAAQLRLPLEEGQIAEDEEPLAELGAPGLSDSAAEMRLLRSILHLARAVQSETKIRALSRLLARSGEPALVFTEYRDTLRHVAATLGRPAAILHGGLTLTERAGEARRFTHGDAPLMLATDAASEGLNLHHRCRLVINLDVPWTPLRLEQRIGRVDRLGQRRRVHGVTLVARGTADEHATATLASRATRAAEEAPFGAAAVSLPALRDRATSEAARLEGVRRLRRWGGVHSDSTARPALGLAPSRNRVILALRLHFVDAHGAIVWDAIKGLSLAAGHPDDRRARTVRSWFAGVVREHASTIAAASIHAHAAELGALSREVGASIEPLIHRERAIAERLTGANARMAAPLVQAGLFDRRALRDAQAQRQVMEAAAARAAARIEALQRMLAMTAGDRTLVFALAPSR
jgi:superfamily II DNA or RNA helicase